jgi:hypothetical protein
MTGHFSKKNGPSLFAVFNCRSRFSVTIRQIRALRDRLFFIIPITEPIGTTSLYRDTQITALHGLFGLI